MYEKLYFRRQFLLTKSLMTLFAGWNCLQINNHYLYTHPDLEINFVQDSQKIIVLMGSIYDPDKPEVSNAAILETIHADSDSVENLFKQIKRYAGSYALIYKDAKNYVIFHDALALREIYYSTQENHVMCGSQPNLVAKFSNPQIGPTRDPALLDFYRNHLKNYSWIGDETYFSGIKHLLPNHYLDLNRREVRRYWPCEPIRRIDLDEAVFNICNFLQGVMKAITFRQPVMMAVTAGIDSRTLLAASKSIKDKIYYFINDENIGYNHPDIAVPEKIFKHIEHPFHVHVHNNSDVIDNEFRQIFLDNVFLATERVLPTIYNVYFKNHSDKVNILGTGEIGRTRFGKDPQWLNSHYLAYKMGYDKCLYALGQCEKILADIVPIARMAGINALTIFQWEQNKGNRWVVGNSESDIAIEEIDPFDSHYLYELFLGVDDEYTKYNNPIIFKKIIRYMWPELLKWPINPPYTMKDKIKHLLTKIEILEPLMQLRYYLNYLRWYFKKLSS